MSKKTIVEGYKRLQKIVPLLSAKLTTDYLESIVSIRFFILNWEKVKKSDLWSSTAHGLRHGDAVAKNVEDAIGKQIESINPTESYILLAASYLHDIGLIAGEALRNKHGNLPIECWPQDIRIQHASLGHAILTRDALLKHIGLCIPESLRGEINVVAEIAKIHTKSLMLRRLEKRIRVSGNWVKTRLLAAIVSLGDELHMGLSRVNLNNLRVERLSLRDRMFWFRYSCVNMVKIDPPSIKLLFGCTKVLSKTIFKGLVVEPILFDLDAKLRTINTILSIYQWPKFRLTHSITSRKLRNPHLVKMMLDVKAVEDGIHSRREALKRHLDDELRRSGIIGRRINNELVCLRRWSSFTPRMPAWRYSGVSRSSPADAKKSLGGGYFLIWHGKGLAIDPGYDFLHNLWHEINIEGERFALEDISGILCTHAHDDHSHDLEPIVSLLHKKRRDTGRPSEFNLYCSEGTHIKYERLLCTNSFIKVEDFISKGPAARTYPIRLDPLPDANLSFLPTDHNEMPWMYNYTGGAIKFDLGTGLDQLKIGYTSDTRYFDGLRDFFRDTKMVILHFGNLGPKSDASPSVRYDKNHLGLNGCHDLIAALRIEEPQLFLLDEFGEEEIVGKDRITLCRLLTYLCSLDAIGKVVIPLDIGLRISLPDLRIYCQICHNFVPFTQIKFRIRGHDKGIQYFCTRHRLS